MRRGSPLSGVLTVISAVVALGVGITTPAGGVASPVSPLRSSLSPVTNVSRSCPGQNAEVEQGVDRSLGYVYEVWMGCRGIGFARSIDGGLHFDAPASVPGSIGSSWDPAIAVAPSGVVYASFMVSKHGFTYPVVAASFNHGVTFSQISSLLPPFRQNWGDRDFIAVGPSGVVYVTWDYGPSSAAVTYICAKAGSCAFKTGDLNVVLQKSTDQGKTWSGITPVSPGFPASGGDSAPLVVEPSGRIDVEYQGYHITNDVTYSMTPAHSYFTSSVDGGNTWSSPVLIGPPNLTMSLAEWWIDGAIGIDATGDLYVTWDTQGPTQDIGWLSYSTDHGKTWSPVLRVTPEADKATHIVEVSGGGPGQAYVGWLTDGSSGGYAQFVRPFSIATGWLSPAIQVSNRFGTPSVWPGDTFGISTLPARNPANRRESSRVVLSWGSAVGNGRKPTSEIFAAVVAFHE